MHKSFYFFQWSSYYVIKYFVKIGFDGNLIKFLKNSLRFVRVHVLKYVNVYFGSAVCKIITEQNNAILMHTSVSV